MKLEILEQIIKYQFKDKNKLKSALTHPSCDHHTNKNFERLEFLGDSVLNLIITEKLISFWSQDCEGNLAKRKAYLVSGDVLFHIGKQINIQDFIYLSEGEEHSGGRQNPHNIEDAMEGLIGAIYLDGGIESAKAFVLFYWGEILESLIKVPESPKTALQEWSQSKLYGIPKYSVISSVGPAHAPKFEVKVQVGEMFEIASAGSKKDAENKAATLLLEKIKNG